MEAAEDTQIKTELDRIYNDPDTTRALDLFESFRAETLNRQSFNKYLDSLPAEAQAESAKIRTLLDNPAATVEADLSTRGGQLAWAAALGLARKETGHTRQSAVWKVLERNPDMQQAFGTAARYLDLSLSNRDATMSWGTPGSWFWFDPEKNHINIDMFHALLLGFGEPPAPGVKGTLNAIGVMLHEVGHSQLTTRWTDGMLAVRKKEQELRAEAEKRALTREEYKQLIRLQMEFSLRARLMNAMEDNCVNRFAANQGRELPYDVGQSLNQANVILQGSGYLLRNNEIARTGDHNDLSKVLEKLQDKLPGGKQKEIAEAQQALEKLATVSMMAFYTSNGLFDAKDAETWKRLGIDPDTIKAADGSGFNELMRENLGANGIAHLQPGPRDSWLLRSIFNRKINTYAERRCKIIDSIWDKFAASHAKVLIDAAEQDAENKMDQKAGQNGAESDKGQQKDQNGKQEGQQQGDQGQPGEDGQESKDQQGQGKPGNGAATAGESGDDEQDQDMNQSSPSPQSDQGQQKQENAQGGQGQQDQKDQKDQQKNGGAGDEQSEENKDSGEDKNQQGGASADKDQQDQQKNGGAGGEESEENKDSGDDKDQQGGASSDKDQQDKDQQGAGGSGSEDKNEDQNKDKAENKDADQQQAGSPSPGGEDEENQDDKPANPINVEGVGEMEGGESSPATPQQDPEHGPGEPEAEADNADADAKNVRNTARDAKEGQDAPSNANDNKATGAQAGNGQQRNGPPSTDLGFDTPNTNQGGKGKGLDLAKLSGRDWHEYRQRINELEPIIAQVSKDLAYVRDRQKQTTRDISKEKERLPHGGGDIRERLDMPAHLNLITKQKTGQKIEDADLDRWKKDQVSQETTSVELWVLADGSGSMEYDLQGGGRRINSAVQSMAVLREAGLRAGFDTFLGMWGDDELRLLAKPGDKDYQIGDKLQAVRDGINSGTALSPSFAQAIEYSAKQELGADGKPKRFAGMTHFLIISDGELNSDDIKPSADMILKLLKYGPEVSIDIAIVGGGGSQMTSMLNLIKSENPMAPVEIIYANTAQEIPVKLTERIKLRVSRGGKNIKGVPDKLKREAFSKASKFIAH